MRSAAASRGRTEAEVLSAGHRTQHLDVDCWPLLRLTAVLSFILHFSHKCDSSYVHPNCRNLKIRK